VLLARFRCLCSCSRAASSVERFVALVDVRGSMLCKQVGSEANTPRLRRGAPVQATVVEAVHKSLGACWGHIDILSREYMLKRGWVGVGDKSSAWGREMNAVYKEVYFGGEAMSYSVQYDSS
jgi:hypothetical protein